MRTSVWPSFFGFILILLILIGAFSPDSIDGALLFLGVWFTMLLYILLVAIVGALLVVAYLVYARVQHNRDRPTDGAYPLQRIRVRGGKTVVINPTHMVGPAAVIDRRTGHYTELEHPAGWDVVASVRHAVERSNAVRAMFPGDRARMDSNGAMSRMPSMAGFRQLEAKQPRIVGTPAPVPAALAAPGTSSRTPLSLPAALQRSTADKWIVGQNPEVGTLATLQPRQSIHAGIIGATGTGKTACAGFMLTAQAIRHGWHAVILDPKGGADWRPWSSVAEWHETDRGLFPDQVRAIEAEHDRRALLMRDAQARSVMELPEPPLPIWVVIEEYGDLIAQLRTATRSEADAVDGMLDRLLRLSRVTDIHLLLIDQYPEHWSQQVMAGTKAKIVFQLGPNQGAKAEEYKANQLPDQGRFLLRRKEYDAWHVAADVGALLRALPARRGPDVVGVAYSIDGERSQGRGEGGNSGESPESNPTPNQRPNADKQQAVWAWRSSNPDGTQAQMRRELSALGIDVSKGYASDCWNAWPPTGAEQLAQMGYALNEVQVLGRKVA